MEQQNNKERFFKLKKPFGHPFMTYPTGTNYTASIWATRLGHDLTEAQFLFWFDTDKRFKTWFEETTDKL